MHHHRLSIYIGGGQTMVGYMCLYRLPAKNGFNIFEWLKKQKKNILQQIKSYMKFQFQCP